MEDRAFATKIIRGWSQVPINENGEPLVKILSAHTPQIKTENKYYTDGIPGSIKGIWVRQSLVPMLQTASTLLPENISLLIWDAFRPRSVQRFLSNQIKKSIEQSRKDILPEAAWEEAARYVTDPDNGTGIPPHMTGGAVDVCLLDSNGDMLQMGTLRDHAGPEAITNYYEYERTIRKLNVNELIAMSNRRILYEVMTQAGFTNYSYEWWHFDFGNQFWGSVSGNVAIYAEAKLPNHC